MKFIFKLLAFSAILYIAYLLAGTSIPQTYRYPHVHYLVLFFAGLMSLFNWWVFRPVTTSGGIVTRYMGATTGKFLICLAVLAVYVLLHKTEAVTFTIHFLALYLLYTVFEVTFLYTAFKNNNGKAS